jgi:hypothetical protein
MPSVGSGPCPPPDSRMPISSMSSSVVGSGTPAASPPPLGQRACGRLVAGALAGLGKVARDREGSLPGLRPSGLRRRSSVIDTGAVSQRTLQRSKAAYSLTKNRSTSDYVLAGSRVVQVRLRVVANSAPPLRGLGFRYRGRHPLQILSSVRPHQAQQVQLRESDNREGLVQGQDGRRRCRPLSTSVLVKGCQISYSRISTGLAFRSSQRTRASLPVLRAEAPPRVGLDTGTSQPLSLA